MLKLIFFKNFKQKERPKTKFTANKLVIRNIVTNANITLNSSRQIAVTIITRTKI